MVRADTGGSSGDLRPNRRNRECFYIAARNALAEAGNG
jgi:hypothetical protein